MNVSVFIVAGMLLVLLSVCGFTIPGTETPPVVTPTPHLTPTPAHTPAHTPTPRPTPANTPTPVPTAAPGKVPIPNGDFETGTYMHWTVGDEGFGTAPSDLNYANAHGLYVDEPYTGYHGRYAASSFLPKRDAGATGTLTSENFTITKPYLEFLVTGIENALLYVEVWVDGEPVKHYLPNNPNTQFKRVSLDVSQWMGRSAYVKVNDGTPNRPWGYIEVDDFYLADVPTVAPS